MSLESANRLAELTGCAPRTVKKRLLHLEPVIRGRAQCYESAAALKAILQPDQKTGGLDPAQEKARLDSARADIAETELAVRRGRLLPADEVTRAWTDHIGVAKARLLSLPSRLGHELANIPEPNQIALILRARITEVLRELAESEGAEDGRL